MDEVLHPVKSRRLIEGSAQHAYDFIQSVIDGSGQAVVDRVALTVMAPGVRVLPPTKHLHVVDDAVADCRERRDRRRVDALPEAVPVLVHALGRMPYVLRINWRQDAAARLEPTWIPVRRVVVPLAVADPALARRRRRPRKKNSDVVPRSVNVRLRYWRCAASWYLSDR